RAQDGAGPMIAPAKRVMLLDAHGEPVASTSRGRRGIVVGGGYTGARTDRRSMQEWDPGSGSANTDTLTGLSLLRGRTRDLARNVPLAGGAISTNVTHVIGTGLRPEP